MLRLIADCGDDAPSLASPLLDIFDEEVFEGDGALDVLDEDFAEDWPQSTLEAAGVLDSFAIVADDEPHEPDHDLPDEEAWWDSLPEPPGTPAPGTPAVSQLDVGKVNAAVAVPVWGQRVVTTLARV